MEGSGRLFFFILFLFSLFEWILSLLVSLCVCFLCLSGRRKFDTDKNNRMPVTIRFVEQNVSNVFSKKWAK